jgi:N-acetylmuramoyl-L-alanine amidase
MKLVFVFFALFVTLGSWPLAQGTAPATPLILLSREGRRAVPTTMLSGQEMIALDDVAPLFQVVVREDTLAGGLTLTYRGRTIVVSSDQPMASVNGRVITLPAPAVRSGGRWLVPIDLLPRALAPIYDQRIDFRRASRLLIVGDLRVPRVTARIDSLGPPTRATIEVTPAAPVNVTTDGGRVVARIDADALDLALPAGGGLIEQFRVGDRPTEVAVILADRSGTTRAVPSEADGVARVTIDVASAAPPPDTAAAPPLPPRPPDAPAPSPLIAKRAALQTIVIDPGHGGDDVGVKGAGGAEEKRITLDVARRLRSIIETRLGVRVILTRDDDRAVSLDDRTAIANNNKADVFLSLHLNASLVPATSGAEIYHLRLDREGEEARRSAASDALVLPAIGGRTREIDVIRWDLAQARHVEASAVLAGMLEATMRPQVAMSPRPRQEAPLRVLTGVNMPAALIEMAYLTNGNQERMAQSDAYQTTLAQTIVDGVLRFRSYLEEARPQ